MPTKSELEKALRKAERENKKLRDELDQLEVIDDDDQLEEPDPEPAERLPCRPGEDDPRGPAEDRDGRRLDERAEER